MYKSAFEHWYKSLHPEVSFVSENEQYSEQDVQIAWLSWRAALDHNTLVTKAALTQGLRDRLNAFLCEDAPLSKGDIRKALQFLPIK